MLETEYVADAVVIGGGFYGCEIALELRCLGFERVTILERERELMQRASFVNQARIHNGYHYPRSIMTAERSHRNVEYFLDQYCDAVESGSRCFYAIAYGSKVNASQFERFCRTVGIACRPAPVRIVRLFDRNLVQAVFQVEEYLLDAQRLSALIEQRLAHAGVDILTGTEAGIEAESPDYVKVSTARGDLRASYVFNCTYAELDSTGVDIQPVIKRELAEMLLIEPPAELEGVGVTVMDGPFFSTLPFPPADLHTLSHVRYTPHEAWDEPFAGDVHPQRSHRDAMLRDSSRYLPCLSRAKVVDSLFEIKAVLRASEDNDGRPILFERHVGHERIFSIMGAKLDNIFDIQENLRAQSWSL